MDDKINFKKLTVIHKNTLNICNWATDIKLCLINLVTVSVYFYATYYTPAANILYQNFFGVFIDDLICRPVQIKARFKHWKNLSCFTFFFFSILDCLRTNKLQQTPFITRSSLWDITEWHLHEKESSPQNKKFNGVWLIKESSVWQWAAPQSPK